MAGVTKEKLDVAERVRAEKIAEWTRRVEADQYARNSRVAAAALVIFWQQLPMHELLMSRHVRTRLDEVDGPL